jgi:alanine-glyoxylate transaminase/serine-glyoxylate transaminase/serine-pyruvate transaminase
MSDLPAAELNPPLRHLFGPGPSPVHPRITRALAAPLLGHLDPAFLRIMDETQALLRLAFQTENALTFPLPGTGSSGMEAAMVNLLEPGDTAIVGVAGFFGERLADAARRLGADVVRVEAEWGTPIPPDTFVAALKQHPHARVAAIVQGETSTGVLQPVAEIARAARDGDTLLVVDAVTSFGGTALPVDAWGVDVVYSCSQKCLGCPPGLAPFTAGPRAAARVESRGVPVPSFYLDLSLLAKYWGSERVYHHTAPAPMTYALHEALRMLHDEGLERRFARHTRNAAAFYAGLEALGLAPLVAAEHRLPMLTTVRIPEGIDDGRVRAALLAEYGIEIGGGLGPLRGRVWRVGLMGHGARPESVLLLLSALERVLAAEGYRAEPGAGLAGAQTVYRAEEDDHAAKST